MTCLSLAMLQMCVSFKTLASKETDCARQVQGTLVQRVSELKIVTSLFLCVDLYMHAQPRVCACVCLCCVCDFAAGTNEAEGDDVEAGGVGDVTKQLEEQTLEERERAEDAEEGNSSSSSTFTGSLQTHPAPICSVIV